MVALADTGGRAGDGERGVSPGAATAVGPFAGGGTASGAEESPVSTGMTASGSSDNSTSVMPWRKACSRTSLQLTKSGSLAGICEA